MIPDDLVRVHAFDWPVQFAPIMKAGGFDAVIGNPPYIRIQGSPKIKSPTLDITIMPRRETTTST